MWHSDIDEHKGAFITIKQKINLYLHFMKS